MKILYLVNARIPTEKAHGVAIVKMVEALAKIGASVELVIPQRSAGQESLITEDLFSYYGLDKVFKVKRLFCFDGQWLHQLGLGKIAFWLRTPVFLLQLVIIVLFNLRQVIYTRDGLIAGVLSFFHRKVFLEIHRLPNSQSKGFYKGVFKRVAGIIAISSAQKENLLKEYGFAAKKIIVAPSAVNLADFSALDQKAARSRYGIGQDKIVVSYIGKFSIIGQSKDFNNLLRVFKEALDKNKNLFLLLGGLKAEDSAVFSEALKNYGLTVDALLLPHVPFKQVKEYYAVSDIFLLPYSSQVLSEYSLSPMKLFEYAACQRPIICPAVENLAEIFNAAEVVFYQPDNYNELGEKILLLAENRDLRLQLAERALVKVKNYSWIVRAAKITDFIKTQLI